MLGYRFAPRFADLGDQRFWRADLPDGSTSDYGVLEAIARNTAGEQPERHDRLAGVSSR